MELLFLEGFLSGLLISMPMGAIGMLCLRYILVQGRASGLAAGFGIALADGVAALISALGLSIVTNFINEHENIIRLIGSILLIGFGFYLLRSHKKTATKETEKGLLHIFTILFVITFTNPLTLLSFTGIFASLGLEETENHLLASLILSFAVFLGSMSWWILLIGITEFFNVDEKQTEIVNKIAGSLLLLMGIVSSIFVFVS